MIYIIYLLRLNKNHTTKKNLTFFILALIAS